jgi:phosphoglycolate phosphatase-like HAD superfamily hydrolase
LGKKYRAVIFDMDGTLLDTLADIADSVNGALEERGWPTHIVETFNRSRIKSNIHENLYPMIPSLLPAP